MKPWHREVKSFTQGSTARKEQAELDLHVWFQSPYCRIPPSEYHNGFVGCISLSHSAVYSADFPDHHSFKGTHFYHSYTIPWWQDFRNVPSQPSFYPKSLAHGSLSRWRDFSRNSLIITSAFHHSSNLVSITSMNLLTKTTGLKEIAGPAGGGKASDGRARPTR